MSIEAKLPDAIQVSSDDDGEEFPEPGHISSCHQWYCCKAGDTVSSVAEKLGISSWSDISNTSQNKDRYGIIGASASLMKNTLLWIPKDKCSPWKIRQLERCKKCAGVAHVCVDCKEETLEDDASVLLCDGCDGQHHVACVGLSSVPSTDWFCSECLGILHQRRGSGEGETSLIPCLPNSDGHPSATKYQDKLKTLLSERRDGELFVLDADHAKALASWTKRETKFMTDIASVEKKLATNQKLWLGELSKHGVKGWSLEQKSRDFIELKYMRLVRKDESTASRYGNKMVLSNRWKNAEKLVGKLSCRKSIQDLESKRSDLEDQLKNFMLDLKSSGDDRRSQRMQERDDYYSIQRTYASLIGAPKVPKESDAAFRRREGTPRLLGFVKLSDANDVRAINMLREPDELIIVVPVVKGEIQLCDLIPKLGSSYAVFARGMLFNRVRDDELPWKGVREAQQRLFQLLVDSQENSGMIVRSPSLPESVRLRNKAIPRCFDLSELVRDCDVALDLPKESTPPILAARGLKLRDYQQSALRWMLDKEKESSEMGVLGELWHRLRFLDGSNEDYYYCELTGSFARTVSDYALDVEQPNASSNIFSLPTGSVLGLEMGLGKTLVVLSLIVANPPPPPQRILPREHIWALEKKAGSDHPSYLPPPEVPTRLVSNGTLVVVPMTLLSQWQTEIERFAPHLSVMVLHNVDKPKLRELAAVDVAIVSTHLIQQTARNVKTKNKKLLSIVKRIHWHRICVDEAHMYTGGQTTRTSLAALSATHRHAITGTPIGSQLADLYGNLRFLRISPFHRPSFWKNLVEEPYYSRDLVGLKVLQSLLSRIVVRYSKNQTRTSGQALLCLPPRSVENVMLTFGSEEEQAVYDALESRNRNQYSKLKEI